MFTNLCPSTETVVAPMIFCQKSVLKNVAKFIRQKFLQVYFLITLQAKPWQRDSGKCFFQCIYSNSYHNFFIKHLWTRLLLEGFFYWNKSSPNPSQPTLHSSWTFEVNWTYVRRLEDVHVVLCIFSVLPQSAFTCSKLTIKTPEQGVKYIQS